jgi:hypothetical protein
VNHPDEIARLRSLRGDRSYVERVQANFYEQEAGKHVYRMLSAFRCRDFVAGVEVAQLIEEYEQISAGLPLAVSYPQLPEVRRTP